MQAVKSFIYKYLNKKNIVYAVFLFAACYLISKIGLNYSKKLESIIFYTLLFVNMELFAQVLLHMFKALKNTKPLEAFLHLVIYIIIMLTISITSAVGVFTAEFKAAASVQSINTSDKLDLITEKDENNQLIKTLTLSLSNETRTGYGGNSRDIMINILALQQSNKIIQKEMKQYKKEVVDLSANWFQPMADLWNFLPFPDVTSDLIKTIIFIVAWLCIQYGLIIFNPEPKTEPVKEYKETEPEPYYLLSPEDKNYFFENRNLFLVYARAMLKDTIKQLNGNSRCIELTGYTKQTAERIRGIIKSIKDTKGNFLIDSSQGLIKLNDTITKERFINLLESGVK